MIDNTTPDQLAAEWFFKELCHVAASRRSHNLTAAEFTALHTTDKIEFFNTAFARFHTESGEPKASTEEGAACIRSFWDTNR